MQSEGKLSRQNEKRKLLSEWIMYFETSCRYSVLEVSSFYLITTKTNIALIKYNKNTPDDMVSQFP